MPETPYHNAIRNGSHGMREQPYSEKAISGALAALSETLTLIKRSNGGRGTESPDDPLFADRYGAWERAHKELVAALPHLRELIGFAHECREQLLAAMEDGASREPAYDEWDLARLDELLLREEARGGLAPDYPPPDPDGGEPAPGATAPANEQRLRDRLRWDLHELLAKHVGRPIEYLYGGLDTPHAIKMRGCYERLFYGLEADFSEIDPDEQPGTRQRLFVGLYERCHGGEGPPNLYVYEVDYPMEVDDLSSTDSAASVRLESHEDLEQWANRTFAGWGVYGL